MILSGIYIVALDVPLLQPEMIWMLAGERLAAGHHMYLDVLDDTGPLSAGIYWILHLMFGKSLLIYKLVGLLIILFQVIYINNLFIRYKSFDENTYLPGLVMVILFHASFDLITLSPALMGSTFVVIALGQLFSQTVLQKEGSDSILLVGIFGGIATCFHFPLVIFLPFMIVVGITVSGFSFNQLVLSILGYFLPLVGCALYYFWIDALPEFILEYILASRTSDVYTHVRYNELGILFATPVFFAIIGYSVGAIFKMITVNQQKQRQIMVIYLVFALLSIFLTNRKTPYQLTILIPGLTYFITQIFIYLKRGILLNVLFVSFLILIPLIGFSWITYKMNGNGIDRYATFVEEKHRITAGKSVLVLGDDLGYYHQAKLATPYLNYRLSKRILEDYDDFTNMAIAYQFFIKEKPEVVIDEEGVFQRLMERLPELEKFYEKESGGIYYKK